MSIYADTQTPSQSRAAGQRRCRDRRWPRARQLLQTVKNRRDATMLAGLDDRMLADIGLTRGDFAMPIPSRSGAIRPQSW